MIRFKNIFSIGVLGVILLQCVAVLILWQIQILCLHARNWNTDNSESIQHISLTSAQYEDYKINDHEIMIDQKMYDIKKLTITSSGVELEAVEDNHEKALIDRINNYFSGTNQLNNGGNGGYLPILFYLNYFQSLVEFNFHDSCYEKRLLNFYENSWINICLSIQTPPPKSNSRLLRVLIQA